MSKKITLENDFHASSCVVMVDERGRISESAYKRANKLLCGVSDCCCGGINRAGVEVRMDGWPRIIGGYIACYDRSEK